MSPCKSDLVRQRLITLVLPGLELLIRVTLDLRLLGLHIEFKQLADSDSICRIVIWRPRDWTARGFLGFERTPFGVMSRVLRARDAD